MHDSVQTMNFQAEVNQLLNLVIHSLYSNKEIFLRELISNASDAADRLRLAALTDTANHDALYENDHHFEIYIEVNKDDRTLTLSDNGIGMDRDEVIRNLGTIARSGTKEFLTRLSGDQKKDAHLIGQFGVGFYSSFIVAESVKVVTRHAGSNPDDGVCWESKGDGEFTVTNVHKEKRGTDVVLTLKSDEKEFLEPWKIRSIVRKYSDHISIPIKMLEEKISEEGKEDGAKISEYVTINRAQALWVLPKSEIKEADYQEFYKHVSNDFEDALVWSHNRVEGTSNNYIGLLFIPSHAPFDLWNRERPRGLKLYVQRIFIMDNAEEFLPLYLRFVKGVIDSNDLPLNISREILQSNKQIESIRSGLTKRVLGMLEKLAEDDKPKYEKFWNEFGVVLKEGPIEDFNNREQIAKLLRFASTQSDSEKQDVSLDDYIKRMPSTQDKIYYVTAENFNAAKYSPHLEIFRKKGIEVLLLSDRIDEWLVAHLNEYQGKALQSISKAGLDLGDIEDKPTKEEEKQQSDDFSEVMKQIREVLKDKIKDVRLSHRLTDSPACIAYDEEGVPLHMQRLLKSAGQKIPDVKPIFEINPKHRLIERLKSQISSNLFSTWAMVLFDQAMLAEGASLEQPGDFVRRLNQLLEQL